MALKHVLKEAYFLPENEEAITSFPFFQRQRLPILTKTHTLPRTLLRRELFK